MSPLTSLVYRIGAPSKVAPSVCNIHPKIFAELAPSLRVCD